MKYKRCNLELEIFTIGAVFLSVGVYAAHGIAAGLITFGTTMVACGAIGLMWHGWER